MQSVRRDNHVYDAGTCEHVLDAGIGVESHKLVVGDYWIHDKHGRCVGHGNQCKGYFAVRSLPSSRVTDSDQVVDTL